MLQLHTREGLLDTADYFFVGNLVILLTGRLMPVDFPPVMEGRPQNKEIRNLFYRSHFDWEVGRFLLGGAQLFL
jgi:hypothetical protein